jgi:hypothetical protein
LSTINIRKVLDQADSIDFTEGLLAYTRYQQLLQEIASVYGFGFVQSVAAFVTLSPNNDYLGNLRSLVSLMIGINEGRSPDQITVSTYGACKLRAHSFLTGEKDFLIETKGPKTRAFYHNILKPEDKKHVTIDGHMYGVWTGKRLRMKEVAHLKIPYNTIAKDIQKVARQEDLIPCQLQAILWFTWKRINNVIYSPQLALLDHNNHWGAVVPVDQIIPFP